MARGNRLKGCYRRVLIFLLIVLAVTLVSGILVYRWIGGVEGARYWMAGRALNKIEAHLLKNRPDGISESDVKSRFDKVRDVNKDYRTDLIKLYKVLKDYQTRFHKTKPSTGEAVEFLTNLEATIFPEE